MELTLGAAHSGDGVESVLVRAEDHAGVRSRPLPSNPQPGCCLSENRACGPAVGAFDWPRDVWSTLIESPTESSREL